MALILSTLLSKKPNVRHWLAKNTSAYRGILKESHTAVVVEGAGCAMMPGYMIASELETDQVVRLFPTSKPTIVGVDFARRKKKNINRCLKQFLRYVDAAQAKAD